MASKVSEFKSLIEELFWELDYQGENLKPFCDDAIDTKEGIERFVKESNSQILLMAADVLSSNVSEWRPVLKVLEGYY